MFFHAPAAWSVGSSSPSTTICGRSLRSQVVHQLRAARAFRQQQTFVALEFPLRLVAGVAVARLPDLPGCCRRVYRTPEVPVDSRRIRASHRGVLERSSLDLD